MSLIFITGEYENKLLMSPSKNSIFHGIWVTAAVHNSHDGDRIGQEPHVAQAQPIIKD